MSENQVNSFANIDSLLSADLSDLADVAGFEVPNNGYYGLAVTAGTKEIGTHPAVILDYEVTEVIELADPLASPPVIGTKFSEAFMIDNEFGLGNLKKALKPYADYFGVTSIGSLLEALQGVSISATLKQRIDKKDATKVYATVSGVTVR